MFEWYMEKCLSNPKEGGKNQKEINDKQITKW
jgi:hypothetical protein